MRNRFLALALVAVLAVLVGWTERADAFGRRAVYTTGGYYAPQYVPGGYYVQEYSTPGVAYYSSSYAYPSVSYSSPSYYYSPGAYAPTYYTPRYGLGSRLRSWSGYRSGYAVPYASGWYPGGYGVYYR